MLESGGGIITPKLDRMFRSALDALAVLGEFKQRGIDLHMIDLGGTVPFGWRREKKEDDDVLVPVPEQQAAIARMKELRAEGLSLRAIRDRLKAEGVKVSHVAVGNALRDAR